MLQIRRAEERGHVQSDWLDSWHSFSFGEYHDPEHMGFSLLRVINEDRIAAEGGFAMHPHRDMEIVTYVISGALQHRDSLGNEGVIHAGEVQWMSAGSGVRHAEFNPSASESTHLLQIWLLPNRRGGEPDYAQHPIAGDDRAGRLELLISPDGRGGSQAAHTDALLQVGSLEPGERVDYPLAPDRCAWLQVAAGRIRSGEQELASGDGAAVREQDLIDLQALESSQVLLFDLPTEP